MNDSVDVDVLRQEARDELAAVIEYRCRQGDDPWEFLPDLPSVDEQVVLTLRRDYLDEEGVGESRARAHHPSVGGGDDGHEFEYELLRRIGLEHPELTGAVWSLLGRI
jgi:hypothetical protein